MIARVGGTLVRIAVLALLFVPCVSSGQTKGGEIAFDVPFAFVVAHQQLPAGHYEVTMVTESVVRLFQPNGRNIVTLSHPGARGEERQGKLVFHRYGDRYFLTGLCLTAGGTVRELYPATAERALKERKVEMELSVVRPPTQASPPPS